MGSTCRSKYRPRKRSTGQKNALAKVHDRNRKAEDVGDKENAGASGTGMRDGRLGEHVQKTSGTELRVNLSNNAMLNQAVTNSGFDSSASDSIPRLAIELKKQKLENMALRERVRAYQMAQHNIRRKLLRSQRTASKLHTELKQYSRGESSRNTRLRNERDAAIAREGHTRKDAESLLARVAEDNRSLRLSSTIVRRQVIALKRQCARFPKILAKNLEKSRTRPVLFRLKQKGIYTSQARMLARALVRSGCSQNKVGDVLRLMAKAMGVSVRDKISARTVRRAVLELGVASDIQTGYEVLQAKNFTVSGDATTNRHINLEARHLLLMLPSDDGQSLVAKNRLLGVESSVDHTSETQFSGWVSKFKQLAQAFNTSPLSRRLGRQLDLETFAVKLKGAGGDHAADQLKTTRKLGEWKRDMTYLFLARKHITLSGELSAPPNDDLPIPADLNHLGSTATSAAIDAAGGLHAWEGLSPEERVGLYASHLEMTTMELGKELYENLSEEERRPLETFVRLGCAMHKDLNAVKGGAAAMSQAYEEDGLPPPILLANKDNASTLRDVDPHFLMNATTAELTDGLTPAELRAFESSSRGAIKLSGLAGTIFNHQDDKKGQHDTYLYYFREIVGWSMRFPDTSNTRYQSHCAASAELLVHLHHTCRFLEVMRDKKIKPIFTNIEENLYKGLHDPPTLTELAVLTLYAQAVSHPYMRVVRQANINGLKLRQHHSRVKEYIQSILGNPDMLLSPFEPSLDSNQHTPAMDGLEWERPEAILAVHNLQPRLPNLRLMLIKFLGGALKVWIKFTAEFDEGGAIDRMSESELDQTWILPTNDHNEGILGARRVWGRRNPSGTEALFNAQKKQEHNETEEFIAMHLNTAEDRQALRQSVRQLEAGGHEAQRRKALTEHSIATANRNAAVVLEKQRAKEGELEALKQRVLIFDEAEINKMSVEKLEEQLEVYRRVHNDADVPVKSKIRRRKDKLDVLLKVVERYRVAAALE